MRPLQKKRLLLVEDDSFFGEFLRRFLDQRNYEVTHSRNGSDALMLLQQVSFDHVVCDINLPDFSGVELYRQLRLLKLPLCKSFIFITGNPLDPDVEDFIRTEQKKILHKPFHINQLFSLLENMSENLLPAPSENPSESVTLPGK